MEDEAGVVFLGPGLGEILGAGNGLGDVTGVVSGDDVGFISPEVDAGVVSSVEADAFAAF